MPKDYYSTLGVGKGASDDDIKRAFHKLAHQHHPDKTGGDDKKFKEINEAYQVLSDKQKRRQYDQFGTTFDQAGMGGGFQGFPGGFGGFGQGGGIKFDFGDDMGGLDDILGGIFGGARGGARRERRGRHIEMDLKLDFNEAVFGVEKELKIYKDKTCDECGGNGVEKGSKVVSCSDCGGTGRVTRVQRTILGSIQTAATCGKCGGEGMVPERACHACRGEGIVKGERKITVEVPAGVDDNEVLRVAGEGEPGGRGGKPGDLYLKIRVASDRRFERQGFDITSKVEIPMPLAALGGTVPVETVDGEVELKIPTGTQPGQVFKLRGKGVPMLKKQGRGDHLVEVLVEIPKKLSREQRKALENWADL
jgi:molecular chaperone DnaJ